MLKTLKIWHYKRKVKVAINILKDLDVMMKMAGYKRSERRRVWKDLSKNDTIVNELKDIYKMGPS